MSVSTKTIPPTAEEKDALILSQQEKITALTFELNNLKRAVFGKKSEKFIPVAQPEQTKMWNEEKPSVAFAESKETISYERRKNKGHGRNAIPDDIYTEVITLEPSDSDKNCICGCPKVLIGYDETKEIEYKPAVLYAIKYLRPKYACRQCPDNGITVAALPARPIDRGVAGVTLIAWIIVSKYLDAMPLYRIESMFKRYGIHINRSSMVGWIEQVCRYLQNIVDAMQKDILQSFCVQGDETTMKVMDKNVQKKTHLGYMFGYIGDGLTALYDYRQGRGRIGPSTILKEYQGKYLMTDGYAGYNEVVGEKNLSQLICWAHARRGVFEAVEQCPEYAEKLLSLIGSLYDIERKAQKELMNAKKRQELRDKESKPLLEKIELLINSPGIVLLPQSPMGKAVAYIINHWKELNVYIEDGNLPIDNNLIERMMRIIAIGRKNYLFCGSHEGAKRAAIIYSLIVTCKLNDINPMDYFTDILVRVADHPQKRIHELTPRAWKMSKNKMQAQ